MNVMTNENLASPLRQGELSPDLGSNGYPELMI
jgi:hypothetical protein